MLRLGARDLPMSTAGAHALSVEALCIAPALPHLFAELMSLHYDPHYQKSQELHFKAWTQRRAVAAADLSDQGIEAVAEAVLAEAPAN